MNNHYTRRYNMFIESIKSLNRTLTIKHKHHIIPKSLGGSDAKDNILECTPREHYICHLLLAKSTETPEMIYAWNMMRKEAKSSRNFESLLIEKYKLMSKRLIGKTSIKNLETGESYFEKVDIAREMVNSGLYKYCGTGFVIVKDESGNKYSVSIDEYKKDKSLIHINSGTFSVFDKTLNKNVKIVHDEYNPEIHITNLTGVTTVKSNNRYIKISSEDYHNNHYEHANSGYVTVRNNDGTTCRVKIDEMKDTQSPIKLGKVNVYFENGTSGEISKEEFRKNRHLYRTHNQNLVTVFEISTGNTIQVSKDDYRLYKNIKYKHPTKGLVLTCPHCGKTGGNSMKRWHFDNCKEKK